MAIPSNNKDSNQKIKHKDLNQFSKYCELVIEAENEIWLLNIIGATISKEALLEDIRAAFNEYYYWMGIAVNQELYHIAGQIREALEEEERHYTQLAKSILKVTINKELKAIHAEFKDKHLGIK